MKRKSIIIGLLVVVGLAVITAIVLTNTSLLQGRVTSELVDIGPIEEEIREEAVQQLIADRAEDKKEDLAALLVEAEAINDELFNDHKPEGISAYDAEDLNELSSVLEIMELKLQEIIDINDEGQDLANEAQELVSDAQEAFTAAENAVGQKEFAIGLREIERDAFNDDIAEADQILSDAEDFVSFCASSGGCLTQARRDRDDAQDALDALLAQKQAVQNVIDTLNDELDDLIVEETEAERYYLQENFHANEAIELSREITGLAIDANITTQQVRDAKIGLEDRFASLEQVEEALEELEEAEEPEEPALDEGEETVEDPSTIPEEPEEPVLDEEETVEEPTNEEETEEIIDETPEEILEEDLGEEIIDETPEEIVEETEEIVIETPETVVTLDCDDPFLDTPGHWAQSYICQLYNDGVVSGKTPNNYGPNESITRAEALKIILSSANYQNADAAGKTESFTDVSGSDWFYPWVVIAENEGLLRNEGGNFNPNQSITRGDFTVLLARIAGKTLYGYTQSDIQFSDVGTSDYFAYAVIIANSTQVEVPSEGTKEIIGGYTDGTFKPNNPISRAEAAALILRAQLAWF